MIRRKHSVKKSESLLKGASKRIPGASQTQAKYPIERFRGAMPLFIKSGRYCRIRDVDGHEYIDYRCSLGPIVLGHAYPVVNRAVMTQLEKGVLFSMASPVEVELASVLCEIIPCAQMARFLKTGSEALSAAVRLSRAVTGRSKTISCGCHGWHDWCAAKDQGPEQGVPEFLKDYILDLPYGDISKMKSLLKKHAKDVACLITVPFDGEDPDQDFLDSARELCTKHDVILVFDETLTGFRLGLGGAQEYFEVTPDLAVFSDAMANGFPIAAVVGQREIMSRFADLRIAGTTAGETVSIVAALATVREIREKDVIKHLWDIGELLMQGLNGVAQKHGVSARAEGLPPMCRFLFHEPTPEKNLTFTNVFTRQLFRHKVFAPDPFWFVSYSHRPEDIEDTLAAADKAMGAALVELGRA